jgi:hypothetical protein
MPNPTGFNSPSPQNYRGNQPPRPHNWHSHIYHYSDSPYYNGTAHQNGWLYSSDIPLNADGRYSYQANTTRSRTSRQMNGQASNNVGERHTARQPDITARVDRQAQRNTIQVNEERRYFEPYRNRLQNAQQFYHQYALQHTSIRPQLETQTIDSGRPPRFYPLFTPDDAEFVPGSPSLPAVLTGSQRIEQVYSPMPARRRRLPPPPAAPLPLADSGYVDYTDGTAMFPCYICYNDVHKQSRVTLPNCTHTFCVECMVKWIQEKTEDELNTTCPACRATVCTPDDWEDVYSPTMLSFGCQLGLTPMEVLQSSQGPDSRMAFAIEQSDLCAYFSRSKWYLVRHGQIKPVRRALFRVAEAISEMFDPEVPTKFLAYQWHRYLNAWLMRESIKASDVTACLVTTLIEYILADVGLCTLSTKSEKTKLAVDMLHGVDTDLEISAEVLNLNGTYHRMVEEPFGSLSITLVNSSDEVPGTRILSGESQEQVRQTSTDLILEAATKPSCSVC